MVKWFRRSAKAWALVVLCSFTPLGTLSTTHDLMCEDEFSPVSIAAHGPGAHTLGTTRIHEAPTHCVLCHWMHSFRAAGIRASRIVIAQTPTPAPSGWAVQSTRAVARLGLAPRAPPA